MLPYKLSIVRWFLKRHFVLIFPLSYSFKPYVEWFKKNLFPLQAVSF